MWESADSAIVWANSISNIWSNSLRNERGLRHVTLRPASVCLLDTRALAPAPDLLHSVLPPLNVEQRAVNSGGHWRALKGLAKLRNDIHRTQEVCCGAMVAAEREIERCERCERASILAIIGSGSRHCAKSLVGTLKIDLARRAAGGHNVAHAQFDTRGVRFVCTDSYMTSFADWLNESFREVRYSFKLTVVVIQRVVFIHIYIV